MSAERELEYVIKELKHMVGAVSADHTIASSDLRRVLRFITKVVQVVDQAFQDVYATLIDVKYLTVADVRSADRLNQLRKDIDLLRARDRYRDAEQICSRLHQLREQYDQQIEPIIHHVADRGTWGHVFRLLDAYEGEIIRIINSSIWELQELLSGSFDERKVESVRNIAAAKAESIRTSLVKLECVRDQILGLSSAEGFLELTETDRATLDKKVTVMIHNEDKSVTHGDRVNVGAGATFSGNLVVANSIQDSFKTIQGSTVEDSLKKELQHLCSQVEQLVTQLSPADQEQVSRRLKSFTEEATSSNPDKEEVKSLGQKIIDIANKVTSMAGPVATAIQAVLKLFGV